MQRRLLSTGTLAALLALTAACDQPTLSGAEEITALEAQYLAAEYDLVGTEGMEWLPSFSVSGEGAAPAAATVSDTRQWTVAIECPLGGSARLEGTTSRTFDPDTRSGTMQGTATRTEENCQFAARRGGGTMTLDSSPGVQMTTSGSIANGKLGVRTTTEKGAFTWKRSTGQSGTCTVDLTSTFDPATRVRTVKGTFCGHAIDVSHTRSVPF